MLLVPHSDGLGQLALRVASLRGQVAPLAYSVSMMAFESAIVDVTLLEASFESLLAYSLAAASLPDGLAGGACYDTRPSLHGPSPPGSPHLPSGDVVLEAGFCSACLMRSCRAELLVIVFSDSAPLALCCTRYVAAAPGTGLARPWLAQGSHAHFFMSLRLCS